MDAQLTCHLQVPALQKQLSEVEAEPVRYGEHSGCRSFKSLGKLGNGQGQLSAALAEVAQLKAEKDTHDRCIMVNFN